MKQIRQIFLPVALRPITALSPYHLHSHKWCFITIITGGTGRPRHKTWLIHKVVLLLHFTQVMSIQIFSNTLQIFSEYPLPDSVAAARGAAGRGSGRDAADHGAGRDVREDGDDREPLLLRALQRRRLQQGALQQPRVQVGQTAGQQYYINITSVKRYFMFYKTCYQWRGMNGDIVVVVGAQIENSYGNIQHVITWIKPKTLIPEYMVPCFSNIPPRLQTFSDEWRMTEDNWIVWSWHVSSLCLDLIYLLMKFCTAAAHRAINGILRNFSVSRGGPYYVLGLLL